MYGQNGQMFPTNMPDQQRLEYLEAMYPRFSQQQQMYNSMNQQTNPYQQQMQQYGGRQEPFQQQQTTQQQLPQGTPIKCQEVTNIDEARAATIEFNGTLYIFPDRYHNAIYTKQVGLNGIPSFKVYIEQPDLPQQQQVIAQQAQIDVEELKNDFNSFKQSVYNKLNEITEKYNMINEVLGGSKDEQL